VHVGVVVRRELRFDIRDRDEAADADVCALKDRKIEVRVDHREVDAVDEIVVEELIAHQTIGSRIAVILAIQRREAEAPIEVIELHRVGKPFDVDDCLIELECVGRIVVRSRRVAARFHVVGADVAAAVDPAINLNVGVT
jgi:hypothetical protein